MICVDLNRKVIKPASGDDLEATYRKAKRLWYINGLVRKYTFPFTVKDHVSEPEVTRLESGEIRVCEVRRSDVFIDKDWRLDGFTTV